MQDTLKQKLLSVKGETLTPATLDLLERIDCPYIRRKRDDAGRTVVDERGFPVITPEFPTLSELAQTLVVLLNVGNPMVLRWVQSGQIEQYANNLLAGLTQDHIRMAHMEIERILYDDKGEETDAERGHVDDGVGSGGDETSPVDAGNPDSSGGD